MNLEETIAYYGCKKCRSMTYQRIRVERVENDADKGTEL